MGSAVGMSISACRAARAWQDGIRAAPAGRIVDGRVEGGYTDVFEFICPGCGDNPYVDYSEVPSRLQWLRGPLTLEAALEAYDKHLAPLPGPNGDNAGS